MRHRPSAWLTSCAAIVVAALAPRAEAQGWAQTIGGSGIDTARAVLATPDGGFVVAGSTTSFGVPAQTTWILKLDALGAIEWQKTYSTGGGGAPCCIEPAAGGGFFVAGNAQSAPGQPALPWLLRLDADGTILLQRSYSGPSSPELHGFAELADGTLVAVGGPDERSDGAAWIMRIDAGGRAFRLDEYAPPGGASAWAVRATPDGGFLVAGATSADIENPGAGHVWLLLLDSGDAIVSQKVLGSDMGINKVNSLDATADGGWLLSGRTPEADLIGEASLVVALDADFVEIWGAHLSNAGVGIPHRQVPAARPTPDGGCLLAGSVSGFTYPERRDASGLVAARLDRTGAVAWQRRYRGSSDGLAVALAVAPDSGAVLVGSSGGDALAMRIDATGADFTCGESVDPLFNMSAFNVRTNDTSLVMTPVSPTSFATSAVGIDSTATAAGVGDSHENDDSCLNPTILHEGGTTRHDFCDDAVDWFELRACAGVTYTIATSNLDPLANTVIDVLSPDCATILASDDDGGGDLASRLDWLAPADGIFLARVRPADGLRGPDRGYDVTLRVAANGCATWARAYGGVAIERRAALAAVPDGTLAVLSVASPEDGSGGWDPVIRRIGASGDALGSQRLTTSGWEDAHDIATTPRGGFVIAGAYAPPGEGTPTVGYLLERDAGGGIAWQRLYARGAVSRLARACALRGGGFAAAGEAEADGYTDLWIVRVDVSGNLQWDLALRPPVWTRFSATSILETSDGGLLVVAATYAVAGIYRTWVIRLDASGSVVWQRAYGEFAGAMRAVEASDGSVFLTIPGGLAKLEPDGDVAWSRIASGVATTAMAATPSGGCVVAGGGVVTTFDAAGNVEWLRRAVAPALRDVAFVAVADAWGAGYLLAGTRRTHGGGQLVVIRIAPDGTLDGSCSLVGAASIASDVATSWISTSAVPVPGAAIVTDGPFVSIDEGLVYDEPCAATNPPLPLEVSPPGSPEPLIFTDHSTLWWETGTVSGSMVFNLYRSEVRGLRHGGAMSCFLRQWPFNAATDPARHWPGNGWAYLVTGVNVAGEGPIGRTSLGMERVNPWPCP